MVHSEVESVLLVQFPSEEISSQGTIPLGAITLSATKIPIASIHFIGITPQLIAPQKQKSSHVNLVYRAASNYGIPSLSHQNYKDF
jgi:hypothetical protein